MRSTRSLRLRSLATVKSQARYRSRRRTPARASFLNTFSIAGRRASSAGLPVNSRSRYARNAAVGCSSLPLPVLQVAQRDHVVVTLEVVHRGADVESWVGLTVARGTDVELGPIRVSLPGRGVQHDDRRVTVEGLPDVGDGSRAGCPQIQTGHEQRDRLTGAEPVVAIPLGRIDGHPVDVRRHRRPGECDATAGGRGPIGHGEVIVGERIQTSPRRDRITPERVRGDDRDRASWPWTRPPRLPARPPSRRRRRPTSPPWWPQPRPGSSVAWRSCLPLCHAGQRTLRQRRIATQKFWGVMSSHARSTPPRRSGSGWRGSTASWSGQEAGSLGSPPSAVVSPSRSSTVTVSAECPLRRNGDGTFSAK